MGVGGKGGPRDRQETVLEMWCLGVCACVPAVCRRDCEQGLMGKELSGGVKEKKTKVIVCQDAHYELLKAQHLCTNY